MKTSRFYLISSVLLLSGLFFSTQSFAQESFKLKGHVQNTMNKTVQNATATLVNAANQQTIEKIVCDKDGEFVFDNVKQGEYILSVSKDGYTKAESRRITIDRNGIITQQSVVINNVKSGNSKLVATN